MQSYYYGCTHSGGSVWGLNQGDLQQHNTPLSYKRSVATIHCKKQTGDVTRRKPLSLPLQHTYLEVVGSNPKTGKNFLGTKFNCSHEWMMLKLTSLSHFLQIQLAQSYLESSFLLFLLPLESISKLLTLTFWLSYLSVLSHTHKPGLGYFPVWACFVGINKIQQPLFAITLSALPLSCLDLLVWWVGNRGDQ